MGCEETGQDAGSSTVCRREWKACAVAPGLAGGHARGGMGMRRVCIDWAAGAAAGAAAVCAQVVLPMLLNDLVKKDDQGVELPNTWVTEQQFYAGLGAVQVSRV